MDPLGIIELPRDRWMNLLGDVNGSRVLEAKDFWFPPKFLPCFGVLFLTPRVGLVLI